MRTLDYAQLLERPQVAFDEEIVRARFEGGLVVNMQSPDRDLRERLYSKFLKDLGVEASPEMVSYLGAVHQWDGHLPRRLIGRNLADCDFEVERDGTVRDNRTLLPMAGPFLRKLELALCTSSQPYPIGRDDDIRTLSNRDFGQFLERVFNTPQRAGSN